MVADTNTLIRYFSRWKIFINSCCYFCVNELGRPLLNRLTNSKLGQLHLESVVHDSRHSIVWMSERLIGWFNKVYTKAWRSVSAYCFFRNQTNQSYLLFKFEKQVTGKISIISQHKHFLKLTRLQMLKGHVFWIWSDFLNLHFGKFVSQSYSILLYSCCGE